LIANRDGFRSSREFEEADSRPRVLFVGDGFVAGDGVDESERFTNILETLQPAWRVDNLGVTGFGPDLTLRALDVVGTRLKPALVVFCMYTDGFRRVQPEFDGAGFAIPRYELESGHLVTVPFPRPNFWNQLRLVRAAEKILWNRTNRTWELNRAILDRFEELGDKQGFKKAIVFLPGTADTRDDRTRRSWLQQYAAGHGTPFLDVSDAIHRAGSRAFLPDNPHYGPVAHQVIAAELNRFLSERQLRASF
jgi:hypothetical protein